MKRTCTMSGSGPDEDKAEAKRGAAQDDGAFTSASSTSASDAPGAKHDGSEAKSDARSHGRASGAAGAAVADGEEEDDDNAGLVSRAVSFYIDDVSLGHPPRPPPPPPPPP